LLAAWLLNVVLMLGAYHYTQGAQLLGVELTGKSDPFKRVRGWDTLAQQYAQRQSLAPGALLLSGDRDVLAQLAYQLRLPVNDVLSWDAGFGVRHQYDLMHQLGAGQIGRDVLLVTHDKTPGALAGRFKSVQELEPVHVQIHRDWALDYKVFLLKDFRG
jgi:hypothetical protein